MVGTLIVDEDAAYDPRSPADVVDLVRVLARQLPDHAIAAILNRSGKLTGRGAAWTRAHVCGLRNTNDIPIYREAERVERGAGGGMSQPLASASSERPETA